jgi:2,3-bisphosphoglycerate-dependent phosphoglycerate mutase
VELLLIRHALPVRIDPSPGRIADPELSEIGRAQAQRLERWLARERIDAVYSSPQRRARETAEPLAAAHGLSVVLEPGVMEFDRDAESYVPLEELKAESYGAWKALVDGGLYASIDIDFFRKTVVTAVERIVAKHPGERVAVVCHGGVINAWAGRVLGIERTIFFEPGYTSVHRFLAASSGERSVVSLNEVAHLRDLEG